MFILLVVINVVYAAQTQYVIHQMQKDIVELQDLADPIIPKTPAKRGGKS